MNELLINAIKLLSANSSEQREYLKKSGSFPCIDEIALMFDDAYRYFHTQKGSLLTTSAFNKLKKINSILNALSDSDNEQEWDEKSLDDQSWAEIRSIAISLMKEEFI
ncbi:hypothetical protein [Mucilaginibacter sp. SJ]|uniref:hypothetical protein n=1 Tax=Mucilaginibacter sp. SJ TaxID=3029053 RepID=UPI0023A97734|nr:hypothetical protein [Mucilaginibacter sp. SJ]WEA03610.1 hypothetical protein MusilaSJ_11745 [Mucilaginibacter sp. SJ]